MLVSIALLRVALSLHVRVYYTTFLYLGEKLRASIANEFAGVKTARVERRPDFRLALPVVRCSQVQAKSACQP